MVLASLERQTLKDFEVVICDDGSRSEIVSELKEHMKKSTLTWSHVWHEDLGFRKNRILNLGIIKAKSDFLIFVDADCLLHPEFVKEYYEHRELKTVLSGRRVELSPWITQNLSEDKIRSGYLEKNMWWMLLAISFRKDSNSPKGVYIKNKLIRSLITQKHRPIVGSNFAGNKIDFESVNGFDLRYEGVGIGEDSDIDYRLQLNGVKVKSMTNIAVQYHMWHPYKDRPSVNEKLFEEVQKEKKARTDFGLQQMK